MRALRPLLLLALLLSAPVTWDRPARALSCAPREMSEQLYQASDAIFIGQTTEGRSPTGDERARLKESGFTGFDPDKLRLYLFTVERVWKGARPGDQVLIAIDSYWGDGFPAGKVILIVAEGKAGDILISPLCGLSRPVAHAGDQIEALERIAP